MSIQDGPIEWEAAADKASRMTEAEIEGALDDIRRTIPHADDLDRLDGANRGGRYRDEASVLRTELKRRDRCCMGPIEDACADCYATVADEGREG